MFLLEYNELGVLEKITPDAPISNKGILVNKLPVSIEEQLVNGTLEKVTEQDKIYYKIIGGNK
jgi:hypothetical protein